MVERVSDFKMPEKVVTRLLKDALPDNVLVSKDAKNAACRSASIFILQLSIAAAEKAQMGKRRTLDNQDIISAVADLGLAEYAPQLVRFAAQRKRNAKRKESSLLKTKTPKKPLTEDTATALRPFSPSTDMTHDTLELTEPSINHATPDDQEENQDESSLDSFPE